MLTADIVYKNTMRKLWEDHIMYTRMFIVSAVAGLPDIDAITNRLMKNQEELAKEIAGNWGEAYVLSLASLLKDHIDIAGKIVMAGKSGNIFEAKQQEGLWYSNADMIINLLTYINPIWGQSLVLKDMFYKHLAFTETEAKNRIAGQYPSDIYWYDQVHESALQMADMLSDGVLSFKRTS